MATIVFQHVFWWLAKQTTHHASDELNAEILMESWKEEQTHIDVICIDVVICAFQNDPRGIICRGREKEKKRGGGGVRLQIEKEREPLTKKERKKIQEGKKKQVEERESVMEGTKG